MCATDTNTKNNYEGCLNDQVMLARHILVWGEAKSFFERVGLVGTPWARFFVILYKHGLKVVGWRIISYFQTANFQSDGKLVEGLCFRNLNNRNKKNYPHQNLQIRNPLLPAFIYCFNWTLGTSACHYPTGFLKFHSPRFRARIIGRRHWHKSRIYRLRKEHTDKHIQTCVCSRLPFILALNLEEWNCNG